MRIQNVILAVGTASAVTIPIVKLPRQETGPSALSISSAALTPKWLQGSDLEQIVELIVKNDDESQPLTWRDSLRVYVESDSLNTVTEGKLIRLGLGQSAVVQVGVKNKDGVAAGSQCNAAVVASWGSDKTTRQDFSGPCGVGDYSPTDESISSHWIPDWMREAKFGIFFHWGLYAAPGFGNGPGPNQDYAEWYWYRMTQEGFPTNTYEYHRDTYGESFGYDDFLSNFTDTKFSPKEWIDLVADAGAKYFVPVTKHHDGWALFNYSESINRRTLAQYGFKRDVLRELFDAAKADHPELHRGTYISTPEWFNPAYVKYGWDQNWKGNYFGRDPVNPYTKEPIEYTGHVEVDDYFDNIQNPQMEALFYDYETELLWCDIGGPHKSPDVIAPWLNRARDQGRQVSYNDRCGTDLAGDFRTPEYAGISFSESSFEGNRGMDPFSFGYNYATPDSAYLTGEEIVLELVNTVVNNGNLLLNIGPKNDGSFPEAEKNNLLDAEDWIRSHGEAIYATRIWNSKQVNGAYRYATKPDAFYIHHVGQPGSQLVFEDPIPWVEGDVVTVVGGSANGEVVNVSRNGDGHVMFDVSNAAINGDRWVWTFKIAYAQA